MRSLRLAALAVGLFSAAFALRVGFLDAAHRARSLVGGGSRSQPLRSPGPVVLRIASFQHRLALADLLWLDIVQELGAHRNLPDAVWNRLGYRGDIVTDLDDKYFAVYHSLGLTMLALSDRIELAEQILLKGMAKLPDRWEFPMFLGYSAYFRRGDPDVGADYVAAAAVLPNAPAYLGALAGRMRFHGGDEATAILMLESMLEHLDEHARGEAETRLQILRSEARLRRFDEACREEQTRTGSIPEPGVVGERLGEPPEDLLGGAITFDERCIARTKLMQVREFEARERVGSRRSVKDETRAHSPEIRVEVGESPGSAPTQTGAQEEPR